MEIVLLEHLDLKGIFIFLYLKIQKYKDLLISISDEFANALIKIKNERDEWCSGIEANSILLSLSK